MSNAPSTSRLPACATWAGPGPLDSKPIPDFGFPPLDVEDDLQEKWRLGIVTMYEEMLNYIAAKGRFWPIPEVEEDA